MRYLETPQGLGSKYPLGVPLDVENRGANDHRAMPIYLIEVHMADASELELERAVRMLDAAMTRMPESTIDHAHDHRRPQW